MAAGDSHTCALLSDETVQCWGDNTYKQLGDGTATARTTPVVAAGLNNVVQITGGNAHTCALTNTDEVKCWGTHQDWTTSNLSTVTGFTSKVVAIDAGIHTDCAQLDTGALQCWGLGQSGLLGNGTTTNSALYDSATGVYTPHAVDVTGYASGGMLLAPADSSADLKLSGLSISGTDNALFTKTGGTCTTTTVLPANQSCTVDLTFTGSTLGTKAAKLDVASNDATTPTLPVALSGVVAKAEESLTKTGVVSGAAADGSSGTMDWIITHANNRANIMENVILTDRMENGHTLVSG